MQQAGDDIAAMRGSRNRTELVKATTMSDINYTEPHPLIAAAIERWNDHVDPGDDDSRVKVAWGLHWRDQRQLEGGPACGIVDGGALLAYRGAEFEMLFGTDIARNRA